jgi:hypothetical protein
MSWAAILVLAAGAYAAKAVGFVGGPRVPSLPRTERVLALLPVVALSALVVVMTLDGGRRLVVDARSVGVVVGALAAWRRAPFAVVVVLAATTTALVRAL